MIPASRALLCSAALLGVLGTPMAVPVAAPVVPAPSETPGLRAAVEEGFRLLGRKEYAAALEAFKRADDLTGGHCGVCLLGLADALWELDRIELAIGAARGAVEALDGAPDVVKAQLQLGGLLLKRRGPGDVEEAERAFTRAVQGGASRADRTAALSGLAVVRFRQQRYLEAVDSAREVLRTDAHGPFGRQARVALCLARTAGYVPGPASTGPWRRWFARVGAAAGAALEPASLCPGTHPSVARFEQRRPMCDLDAWVSLFDPSDGAPGAIHRVGWDVEKPEKISAPPPRYSTEARRARIQGRVILEAIIDSEGCLTSVHVLKRLHQDLDRKALEAVKNWVFEPAKLAGNPVNVYYTLTVNFEVQPGP
jgi:TonB family protein